MGADSFVTWTAVLSWYETRPTPSVHRSRSGRTTSRRLAAPVRSRGDILGTHGVKTAGASVNCGSLKGTVAA
jgi:propanediol utilization protein